MKYPAIIFISMMFFTYSCKSKKIQELPPEQFSSNLNGKGQEMVIEFKKGEEHNHPLMAIWVEDLNGNFIQNLYITRSIATGVFGHGDSSQGVWKPGKIRRPAALPVWAHKRGIMAGDGLFIPDENSQVADAYSGATPWGDFLLKTRLDESLSGKISVRFEINQTWDWNEYWTNNKYPENEEYKTSCQPALVYEAIVDLDSETLIYPMKVLGHSHYAGENGEIYTDLSTITTALEIVEELTVKLEN